MTVFDDSLISLNFIKGGKKFCRCLPHGFGSRGLKALITPLPPLAATRHAARGRRSLFDCRAADLARSP